MTFVVDASVTMAWCFDDEATTATEAVLDRLRQEEATAPVLWSHEVANVLLVAERRKRITEAQSARFLELLTRLPIRVADSRVEPAALVGIGRRHQLSAYDAAYLLLAEQLGAPMATLDDQLTAACDAAGVQLLIDH